MKQYIVSRPFRGEQFYLVSAASGAEAKRKVANHDMNAEEVGYEVTATYRPNKARIDEPDDA